MGISFIPTFKFKERLVPGTAMFMDSGVMDLNKDGSSTAKIYTAGPASGEIWYLRRLILFIEDSGTMDVGDFGAIAGGLTNGLLVETDIMGTLYTFHNFKINKMLGIHFGGEGHHFAGGSPGFLNSNNTYVGGHEFIERIKLKGNDSDHMKITNRDNLSSISHLNFAISYYRVVA